MQAERAQLHTGKKIVIQSKIVRLNSRNYSNPSGEVLQLSIEKGYTFFSYKSFGSDRKRIEISLLFQYFFQKSPSVWMENLKT